MRILLDENFPLARERQLRARGFEVEHIILLGLRGLALRAFGSACASNTCCS